MSGIFPITGNSAPTGFYDHTIDQSLRFEDADSAYLTRTNSSAGNRRTWTFSAWVKRGDMVSSDSSQNYILGATTDNYNLNWAVFFFGSDELTFYSYTNTENYQLHTSGVFRDPSAWYHLVLAWDTTQSTAADRIILYVNGARQVLDTYNAPSLNYEEAYINNNIQQDLGKAATAGKGYDGYMAEVHFVDGTALAPTSFGRTKAGIWIPKEYTGSHGTNGYHLPFKSTVTATGQSTVLYTGTGASRSVEGMGYKPDLLWIKDRSGTNNHNLSDRVRGSGERLYSNLANTGESQTFSGTTNLLSFESDGFSLGNGGDTNTSGNELVAWGWDAGADQAATGFGCVTFTGSGSLRPVTDIGFSPDLVWIKSRTSSGLGNILFDSVRGVGKYLFSSGTDAEGSGSGILDTFNADGFNLGSNGHVNQSGDNYVAWCWDAGDSAPASNTDGSITSTVKASTANGFSIVTGTTPSSFTSYSFGHGLDSAPEVVIWKETENTSNWNSWHTGLSNSSNLIQLNTTSAEQSGSYYGTINNSIVTQTGNTFSNTNSDFVAYCWHSVSGYSKIGSYTGTGSAGNAVTGLGFRPAWIMIKKTNSTEDWAVYDSTRSPFNTVNKLLKPNLGDAENTPSLNVLDFDSDGFTIQGSGNTINTSGSNYIYMAFAGGKDTIAPLNTNGSTTSRAKASNDTGFSVVQYEGTGANATFGHGLSSAPNWVVVKNRSFATNWTVYHSANTGSPAGQYLSLNLSDGTNSGSGVVWNSTAPTSSVVSIGTGNAVNRSGDEFIAYCWTATTGKSAFGNFTGNGSSSGPAVTGLGFKPALLILKNSTDDNTNWIMLDDKRDVDTSDVDSYLKTDANSAEVTDNADILLSFDSDGFTLKTAGNDINGSGDTILYMAFADGREASFFYDQSGNGNNFDPTGLQNSDVLLDSPTNNFATMNPVDGNGPDIREGNLKPFGDTASAVFEGFKGTFPMSSGKWYWEMHAADVNNLMQVGITPVKATGVGSSTNLSYHTDAMIYNNGGTKAIGTGGFGTGASSKTTTSYGASYTDGDIIGIALDLDSATTTLEFFKNNVSQGTAFSSLANDEYVALYTGIESSFGIFNFGQDSSFAGTKAAQGNTDDNGNGDFYYTPPSGYLACCSASLTDPAIDPDSGQEPEDYFNTVLYTGTGSSLAVTGVGHQPDFVWFKARSSAIGHLLYDNVRGATKYLQSASTSAEGTGSDSLTAFDSDGFNLGADTSTTGVNQSSTTYVAWNWKAGGTAVSNTDGSITSSVSANTKAGFSIVSYTGNGSTSPYPSIGHGLSSAPEIIFCKSRDSSVNWIVYHTLVDGSLDFLYLNATNANSNAAPSVPTSSVFYVGGNANESGEDTIAYCFHSVDGYSKTGTYRGNGSANGSFVYTGFRPSWVMLKRTDTTGSWSILDIKRDTSNVMGSELFADLSNAEQSNSSDIDFVSNGFKFRRNYTDNNSSGTYIYLAFADQPFKYSNAR